MRKCWDSWKLRRLRWDLLKHKYLKGEPSSFHWYPVTKPEVPSEHQETFFSVRATKEWSRLPLLWNVVESLSFLGDIQIPSGWGTMQPAQGDLAWVGSWTRRPEISASLNPHPKLLKMESHTSIFVIIFMFLHLIENKWPALLSFTVHISLLLKWAVEKALR